MRIHKFIFEGTPIPLARPRFTGRHCWDSQKQHKLVIGLSMSKQFAGQEILTTPLKADFYFFFPTAKRIAQSKKESLYNTPFMSRPDLDNCIKFYLDCANTILYEDDAQICSINAHKMYGPRPETVMTLTELFIP